LSATTSSADNVCIVGCGRWLRTDDQAGLLVARELQRTGLPRVRILLTEAPAMDLLNGLDGISLLILVDAARSDRDHRPGTWKKIDYLARRDRLKESGMNDTHGLGVEFALSLAREIGGLPPDVWIYAVAAAECGYGEQVTPEIEHAIRILTRWIPTDIQAWRATMEHGNA